MTWKPDYCTTAELKSYLRIGDSADDTFIALWITTVSRNVDDFTGRQFGQVDSAEDRYYTANYYRHEKAWIAEIDDLQDTTGLTVTAEGGTTISSDDYTLLPRNAAVLGRPYEQLRVTSCPGELTINSNKWGWSTVPAAVKIGIFLQGARLAARRDSPFGISGSPQDQGEIRLLAQLDPDFRTSLKPLIRQWWAA